MKLGVAGCAAVLLTACALLFGEPGSASAQEMEATFVQRAVLVDQGLLDGTAEGAPAGDGLPPANTLDELVQRIAARDTDDREHECLAGAVYFESKGEPLDGQLAVAEVIMNRARSGRFPETACGVVFQRGQFSFVRGGGFPPINRASRQWAEAVAIARVAMDEAWDSSVENAMFFHAARLSPGWNRARVARVGNHVFYR